MFNLGVAKHFLTRAVGTGSLILRRVKPEIYTGLGIVFGGACVVVACVKTLKVETIVDETKEELAHIHTVREECPERYSDEDSKKDSLIIYGRAAVSFVKLYAIPAGLEALSIGFILGGHHILRKENAAVTAAYMALSESFKSYRKRVIADVGEDKDKEYRFGVTKELVQVTNEDGSKEMVERTVIDPTTVSQYARFFDAGNPNWTRNPEMNLMFLRSQQNWANDLLHARGHVFLNEVYDMLGMPRSEPGCVVGWVDGHGDSFIDFGFYNGVDSASRDFVNGFEKTVLLDFNVDGMIMDIFNKKAFRDRLGAER